MMILRSSPTSPFVRKVRIAIGMLGLDERVELHNADLNTAAEPLRPNHACRPPAWLTRRGFPILLGQTFRGAAYHG